MRLGGRICDGSGSMFRTQQDLVKRVGHAVWLTEFTPARIEHLGFVNRLLHTFCELDICCALVIARTFLTLNPVTYLQPNSPLTAEGYTIPYPRYLPNFTAAKRLFNNL